MTLTNVQHSSSMAEAATSCSHVTAFSTSLEEYDWYDAEIKYLAASSISSEELETGCCEVQSGARRNLPGTCLIVTRYMRERILKLNSRGLGIRSSGWSLKIAVSGL